ncbi:antA/AntB antirepressor family protein [Clostridium sardiniense]|uniref:antA/AntB antirepressor family protein n=1 Tax=Clostridium sardiniense TaxID=29369 RepID=UPI00195BD5E2|nr:antA/AntB antirepressor family protein [Clostridium sardiniense]MBM7835747.1 phage anti-repressor protein [Clostridium sardiniense]
MKKFQKTINGEKYKGEKFERLDIINKFNRSEKEWNLIDQYQNTFPQLLLQDVEGFIIDARILWSELGEPQGKFADWVKRKIVGIYRENKDFEVIRKLEKNSKGGRPEENYILTLETAKALALSIGTTKNSSEEVRNKGRLVRDYFILIEKILKEYEDWIKERNPERAGYKEMKQAIYEWCIRKGYDCLNETFYSREGNMLNVVLTGQRAIDLRFIKGIIDNQTRDNLDIEVNKALSDLQNNNSMLLANNMEFEIRKQFLENYCNMKYKNIRENFNKINNK